jgi:hypothetical protein
MTIITIIIILGITSVIKTEKIMLEQAYFNKAAIIRFHQKRPQKIIINK